MIEELEERDRRRRPSKVLSPEGGAAAGDGELVVALVREAVARWRAKLR